MITKTESWYLSQLNNIGLIKNVKEFQVGNDVLCEIFKYLNGIDLCKAAQVSKQWKRISGINELWVNLIKLYDFTPCDYSGSYYSFSFNESQYYFSTKNKFKDEVKGSILLRRIEFLSQPYFDDGASFIANLFGGLENVLTLPKGSVPEEFLKEWTSHVTPFPRWHLLGDNVQDSSICRIDVLRRKFIAIRCVRNLLPNESFYIADGLGQKVYERMGGPVEFKIILEALRPFHWKIDLDLGLDPYHFFNRSFDVHLWHEDIEESERPEVWEWLKKVISGKPFGLLRDERICDSFSDKYIFNGSFLGARKPFKFIYIEGPSINEEGKPVCELFSKERREISKLNIIDDYFPKDPSK